MKQREHGRIINDRFILVNRGHNPNRHKPAVEHNIASMRSGLGDLAVSGTPKLRPPKEVSYLKDAWYSALHQFFGKNRFPQSDGSIVAINGFSRAVRIAPFTHFEDEFSLSHTSCVDMDLTGSVFEMNRLVYPDFNNSVLDGAVFSSGGGVDAQSSPLAKNLYASLDIHYGNWEGASLRGAVFHNVNFSGSTNFRDTDLKGADFTNAKSNGVVDVRGSNITADQFKTLVGNSRDSTDVGSSFKIEFDFVTASELVDDHGADRDELVVLLWSGEIESVHRDGTALDDPNDFDPEVHVIPIWEAEKFLK